MHLGATILARMVEIESKSYLLIQDRKTDNVTIKALIIYSVMAA